MTKPISVPKLLDTLSNIASEVPMQAASDTVGRDSTSTPEATSKSAVDSTASVLEELAGMGLGEQFLREFVEQCLRDIGRCMSQLQSASANADYDGMRESAHALRGVAENIGAIRLVERCRLVMRINNVQLAKQSAHLTRDLDALVEQTAREVHAQLPQLLNPGLSRLDPKPGPDPL
jgi:two-component system sensor histidine kinase RpfC